MSKKRDWEFGPKPQDVPITREKIQSPARKPYPGYCKKLKGDHIFELDEVEIYKHLGYPPGMPLRGPLSMKGWVDWKTYRCTACGKKKYEIIYQTLDEPVLFSKERP